MVDKKFDVVGICNALVDILLEVDEATITHFELTKGVMHLVDAERQKALLNYLAEADKTIELGGSTLNALRSLAGMGAKTSMAGMIGRDDFGQMITSRMQDLAIHPVLGVSDEHTGTCLVMITPDGERTMNTCLGASRLYDHSNVPHAQIKDSRILHFCGYQWDTDQQKAAIYQAIETAKKHGTLVSFDVADPFVVERNRDEFLQLIKDHADIVFSNEKETELLFKLSPEEALKQITASGAVGVIKLGARGAIVGKGEEKVTIAAEKTSVIDTTAAGDMFAAGFLYGYSQGKDISTAGKTAATLAACVISRIGTSVLTETLARARQL